jgi:hypothetical protein
LEGTPRDKRGFVSMRPNPKQCREHAEHCRKMAAEAPPGLAHEFERLAQTWVRLADDLERAEAFRPDVAPNVIPLRRAGS